MVDGSYEEIIKLDNVEVLWNLIKQKDYTKYFIKEDMNLKVRISYFITKGSLNQKKSVIFLIISDDW